MIKKLQFGLIAFLAAAGPAVSQQYSAEPGSGFSAATPSAALFGLRGDDSTDNSAAFALAQGYADTYGAVIQFPPGIYRTSTGIILKGAGGFRGSSAGMAYDSQNAGPAGASHGTVIRFTGTTGDTITIAPTARNAVVRDIGFWPVLFKTSGFEVVDRGSNTVLENLNAAYTYGCFSFQAGSNSSTASHLRCFAPWGPAAIKIQGATSALADWAQAIILRDISVYSPWSGAEPHHAIVKGTWKASTIYAVGDVVTANGYVWQAVAGGKSHNAGSGPIIPAYRYAGQATDTVGRVADGEELRWRMIQSSALACINVDSNAVDIVIREAQLLTCYTGLSITNSLGSGIGPQYVKLVDSLIDHTVSHGVDLQSGYQIILRDTDLHLSATGRGLHSADGAVFTASVSGQTMSVTAVVSGALAIGQFVSGPNVNAVITAFGSGRGSIGTYLLSSAQTSGGTKLIAAGPLGGLTVQGGHIWSNALDGIKPPPIAGANTIISGVRIAGNSVASPNTYDGIAIADGTTGISICNNVIGPDRGGGGIQRYAISIAATASQFNLACGNIMVGNGLGDVLNFAGTGVERRGSGQ